MVGTILEIIKSVLGLVPIIDKWFRKSSMEKEQKAKDNVRDQVDHAKKTGRPKWD